MAPRTPAEITADLHALGVVPGDVVMVHASLRAVGPVEGRAAGLVAALDAAVGPDGTLLMVLGARDDWAWVNQRPEADRPALLAEAEPFDALRTPASPDVGTLAEVFRTLPGTRVNDHPEGRFAARGARAAAMLDDPPWDDYYGPGSPLERLVAAGGKVLRLGASPDTCTVLHFAEFLAPVPAKRRARRLRRVVAPDAPGGTALRWVDSLDDENGIVDVDGEDYFSRILHAYLATGRARAGRVGGATSELLDAGDFVAFGAAWMGEHLRGAPPG